MRTSYTPGPGWRKLCDGVYDHESGAVVHQYGILRLPDGVIIIGARWPESKELQRYIDINGGRRRGILGWARSKMKVRVTPSSTARRLDEIFEETR